MRKVAKCNSEFDLSADEYKLLYRRFLERSPRDLFKAGFMRHGLLVLDLCAGSMGRASIQALKMGAKGVAAVDLDPHVKQLRKIDKRIIPFNESVTDFFSYCADVAHVRRQFCPEEHSNQIFDLAICQQGINYWFNKTSIGMLSRVLKKNGVFVFNTFNTPPDATVTHRDYIIGKKSYMEVYQRIGNVIHHVQFVDGHAPHSTTFMWIPKQTFLEILKPHFRNVQVTDDGATAIYRCIR